ncbi:MAG: energy transducer TonB [Terracidiphilus sp.]
MRKLACLLLVVIALEGWAQSPVLQPDLQPDRDGVYVPGGDVNAPKLVHTAPAEFPADWMGKGLKLRCIVSTVIGTDGRPKSMSVEEPKAGPFGTAAMEAIRQSEFKPGTLHGSPVPVRVEIWVPFVEGEKRAVPELMPIHLSFHP